MKGLLANQPEALDDRCTTFIRLGVWPGSVVLNWRGWLSNFQTDELRFARCLLEAFCYFGRTQTEALLRAAFHGLSREVAVGAGSPAAATTEWRQFLAKAVITFVEGERPSPTDSGYTFARRARDRLGIPERRVVFPQRALELGLSDPSQPIVFIDDLVGSGEQFCKTWLRKHSDLSNASFGVAALTNVWYVPLIASWKGAERIARIAGSVRLRPAHLLSEEYSAVSDKSIIWPNGAHVEARSFVESASQRAGYNPGDAWGFHRLGMAVAVDDTIPDFSLPLFYSTRNGWVPLMRRASA
jgi:hypothetical protein